MMADHVTQNPLFIYSSFDDVLGSETLQNHYVFYKIYINHAVNERI